MLDGSLTSKPAWSNTFGCSATPAFFVFIPAGSSQHPIEATSIRAHLSDHGSATVLPLLIASHAAISSRSACSLRQTEKAGSRRRSVTGVFGTLWSINDVAFLFLDGHCVGRCCPLRTIGSRSARTRRALHEVRKSMRGVSTPVRLLLQALLDPDGQRQEGTRQDRPTMRRLCRVLQDVFHPVRPPEPALSAHAGMLREMLRRLRRGMREDLGR